MAKVAPKALRRARALRRNLTNAEVILWSRLRRAALGVRFRRQHPIGPYIADFACIQARMVVEVDGDTHNTDAERRHDARRDGFIRERGWHVVRVWNRDVYESLDEVVAFVCEMARTRTHALASAPSTASRSPSPALRAVEER